MGLADGGTTSPLLLERLGDWSDDAAWNEFVARYRPLIELWCRRMRLDADTTEELCQRIWIALAHRMSSFEYDPSRKFRGWLKRLCHSRAIDLIRERRRQRVEAVEQDLIAAWPADFADGNENEVAACDSALLRLGKQCHAAVQSRVAPQTWGVFWSIAVEGHSVRETATAFKMSYAAAFAAHKRVAARLRAEGKRLMAERGARRSSARRGGRPADRSRELDRRLPIEATDHVDLSF
jgi:RNA polymerase sigma factor (sigma-70 family)